MRRDSRRELATDIEDLNKSTATESDADRHLIVYEHPETGDWYNSRDCAGDPLDDDDVDAGMVIVLDAGYTEGDIGT